MLILGAEGERAVMRAILGIACSAALAVAGCGGPRASWNQPVAASVLGAVVANSVIRAATGKTGHDKPVCKPPERPQIPGCFSAPHGHDNDESCNYFCLEHCTYHVAEPAPVAGPRAPELPYDMAPGCLPSGTPKVEGCLAKDLLQAHDPDAPCAYFCVTHCTFHDGARGRIVR